MYYIPGTQEGETGTRPRRGRPRDVDIDHRILAVAQRHLAVDGYEGLSLAAVAEEAGTTRQALYRRWTGKADLATAAIAAMSEAEARAPTDDPLADVVAELEAFRSGISRPDGVSMVGTMLQRSTDPRLVALFQARIVRPRRTRIRSILERGRALGLLDASADLDVAVSMLTGSWYAIMLAGTRPPRDWATRVAAIAWRGLGGTESSPARPRAVSGGSPRGTA
jgi:AcrR family transcriptional regulator